MESSRLRLPNAVETATAGTLGWAIGLAATVAVAVVVVIAQPIHGPWWIYADADATYVGSGLNLMAGEHTFYLDHPGMPLQDLLAATDEARYAAHQVFRGGTSPHVWAGQQLLDLDASRPYWRTYAGAFYLLGAVLAFLVPALLLRSPLWGLGGGLLWVGAPGLAEMSIQYRPDVLLAGLCLLIGFLIARGAERRDPWLYVLASFTLGITATLKIHVAGLLLPLLIALAVRPPGLTWRSELRAGFGGWLRRYRVPLTLALGFWALFVVLFNRGRFPPPATHTQHDVLVAALAYLIAFTVAVAATTQLPRIPVVSRVLHPLHAIALWALALGIFLPGALFASDGLEMLVKMRDGLGGGGVNEGIAPFAIPWAQFEHWPLREALVVFVLAGAAAVWGALRRELAPILWFSGAAAMGVMAATRLGAVHYFAPAFVLSIPPALWLCRRRGGTAGIAAAVLVVAVVLVPQLRHLDDPAHAATLAARQNAAAESIAGSLLRPGEVALTEYLAAPNPDARFYGLVQDVTAWTPEYPYRFLPDLPHAAQAAQARDLRLAYYIGFLPTSLSQQTTVRLLIGSYVLRPLPGFDDRAVGIGAAEIVHGPGADRPWGHPDAPYDPWTGYYEDPAGHYYDIGGNAVSSPRRRKYLPRQHLWLDAFGDFWNASGKLVRSDPSLRTAP